MTTENAPFLHTPSPDNPGWHTWKLDDPTRFNGVVMGPLLVRREGGNTAILRMMPLRHHSNLHDNVHGGVTLALIDVALFAAAFVVLGGDVGGAVTLELSNQFIGAGRVGQPLDASVEVLRETKRLIFLRGLVLQEDHLVASFTGTLRKPTAKK